jgi:hypothetical protein
MKTKVVLTTLGTLLVAGGALEAASPTWTKSQAEVLAAMDRLSATTAPGGTGADGYARLLAPGYNRWMMGSGGVSDAAAWLPGLREWLEEGWRVTARESEVLEVLLVGDLALTRRVVTETHRSPQGEESLAKAALAEAWVREEGEWRLLRANVLPLESSP